MTEKKKRCPNGTQRNKKTGQCNKIKGVNKTKKTKLAPKPPAPKPVITKKSPPKTRKICPAKKPLYNPVTNRCVLDTPMNRKKIALLKSGSIKSIPKPVIVKPPTPKPPTPKPVKKCPPSKPLYNPKTRRCLLNTLANLKKLGLEFKQKADVIEKTEKFKKIVKEVTKTKEYLETQLNQDSKKADLLENFDKVLDNIWHGSMYKLLIAMYYLLKRHKNACFLSADVNTPQKRIDYEKFNIMYKKDRRFYVYNGMEIVYRKSDKNKQQIRSNSTIVEYMMVPKTLNIRQQIEKCKRNNKRFVIGLIYFSNDLVTQSAHENSYIYDIQNQTLEIFEPNGAFDNVFNKKYGLKNFYKEFLNYFKKIAVPIRKFYKPMDYCPLRGPQSYDYYTSRLIKNPPGGYCAAWSIYYLDARLSNPNVPRDLLITFMIKKFRYDSAVFINSYSKFILTNFLTNVLDIEKINEMYPNFLNNFNNNKLSRPEKKYLEEQLVEQSDTLIKLL